MMQLSKIFQSVLCILFLLEMPSIKTLAGFRDTIHTNNYNVNLTLNNFTAAGYTAIGFEGSDKKEGHLDVNKLSITKKDATHFMLSMPQFSFAKITLTKNKP